MQFKIKKKKKWLTSSLGQYSYIYLFIYTNNYYDDGDDDDDDDDD